MHRETPNYFLCVCDCCGNTVLTLSTPQASKVHCSINGLENSSSPEYSKVQYLFEITVGLFSVRVGLFLVGGGLFPSPTVTGKKSYSYKKKSYCNLKKVLDFGIFQ